VGEAGALEVVDRRRVDAIVLPEEKPAQERRLGVGRAAFQGGGRTAPDAVHGTREAGAALARRCDGPGAEHLANAESRQVVRLPWPRLRQRPARAHLAADREVRHRLVALEDQPACGRADPDRDVAVRPVGNRGHVAGHLRVATGRPVEGAAVDGREPQGANRHPAGRGGKGDEGEPCDSGPVSRTPRNGQHPARDHRRRQERRCIRVCRHGR
jgi:hypothetical protein